MPMITNRLLASAAVAALVGSLAAASPSFAQNSTSNVQPGGSMQMEQPNAPAAAGKKMHGPAAMKAAVERRIKTLHDKLKITPDQEADWNDVAQTMRDNEANIGQLIQQRHQNSASMTAVDDLNSYASIAQAHADGAKKLASSFENLYDSMSPEQKKNADEVFGRFEGHRGMAKSHRSHNGSTGQ